MRSFFGFGGSFAEVAEEGCGEGERDWEAEDGDSDIASGARSVITIVSSVGDIGSGAGYEPNSSSVGDIGAGAGAGDETNSVS